MINHQNVTTEALLVGALSSTVLKLSPLFSEMTEEEMLDLAMRLSEQEASNTALRQRQEEETMRKAIAESLYVSVENIDRNKRSPGHSL